MTPADMITLAGVMMVGGVLLLAGWSMRRRMVAVAFTLPVLACLAPVVAPGLSGLQWFLAWAGPALVALGLAGGRVMLERSVSLALLEAFESGTDAGPLFEALVHRRMQDLLDHGLALRQGDRLVLTVRGRFWAGVTRYLRVILGVRP